MEQLIIPAYILGAIIVIAMIELIKRSLDPVGVLARFYPLFNLVLSFMVAFIVESDSGYVYDALIIFSASYLGYDQILKRFRGEET